MARTLTPLVALLSGVALLLLGSGLLSLLIAVRGGIEGFDSQTLGLIGAMNFLGFLAGTYIGPQLIRRVGHVRALAFFTTAVACAALLHELLLSAWAWAILRFLTGTVMVGCYTIIESWLNSQAAPEMRSRVFAIYMGVNLGALALAQQFIQWSDPAQHILFSVAAVSICAAIMPISATRLAQPHIDKVASIALRKLFVRSPVACIAAVFSGLAQGAFWGLGAVWADVSKLGTSGIAWVMTTAIIGGALFQWPIGRMTQRFERGHVISLVAFATAGLAIFLPFAVTYNFAAVLLVWFLYGGLAFALYPLAVARLMDRLDKAEMIAGCGSLLLLHGIGAAVGPLAAGSLMKYFGPNALPIWFATVESLLGIATWWIARRMAPDTDIAHQTPLMPMVRTSPAALEMLDTTSSKASPTQ